MKSTKNRAEGPIFNTLNGLIPKNVLIFLRWFGINRAEGPILIHFLVLMSSNFWYEKIKKTLLHVGFKIIKNY